MDHRIRSRRRRVRAVRFGLLRDWYGEEAARTEMAAHTHPGEELSDALDRVLNELEGDELSDYARLAANWKTYCGEALEKYLTLGGLRNGVLTLTVPHSGLLSMIAPSVELIQARIAADFGPGFCREIRLASGGRRRPASR
ncbi:MAG: DUF721 domain-containing protein [Lentisphaeria bacterium]|nr:DUF721 domain-containing protein [Lentisphaeria bacterium]